MGRSLSTQLLDARLEMIDRALELNLRQLEQGLGTGAYFGSVSVLAESPDAGVRIGRALSGALAGSLSHVAPFSVVPYSGQGSHALLTTTNAAKDVIEGVSLLNTLQAGQLLMLPDAELPPGLRLKRNVFYGRAVSVARKGTPVSLGRSAFLEPTMSQVYQRMVEEQLTAREHEVHVPDEDLLSHLLIAGTTSSGKTVRARKLLEGLDPNDFRVIVIETAKKTFRGYLRRQGREPTIYALGSTEGRPLRINPFYFDPGTSLKRHVSVIADALSDLMPVEALIGPKMREALLNCYFAYSWNVETGEYEGPGEPVYPTMIDFNQRVVTICERLSYSSEINQNYRGALLGRAKLFIDDLYQDLFAVGGDRPFDELFSDDTIVELDDLPPSEINMPAFVVSLLLQRLRAHRACLGKSGPRYIVVIEEAHNILNRNLEQRRDPHQTGGSSHLLQHVVRLLQEGRELGIGVIVVDQSPSSLAEAVLKNTNTKLVHRLVDGEELRVVGTAIGLEEDEWGDLGQLDDGECVVSLKSGGRPVKLALFPESELGKWQEPPAVDMAPLPYAACQRLLDEAAGAPGSLANLARLSSKLWERCHGDLEVVGYMIGKYMAWRELLNDKRPWRAPRSKEETDGWVFRLAGVGLAADEELDRLLLAELSGVPQTAGLVCRAEPLLGERWAVLEAAALADQVVSLAEEVCLDTEPAQDAAEVLVTWARGVQAGQEAGELVALLQVRLLAGEAWGMLVAALLARHWRRHRPTAAALDAVAEALAVRHWKDLRARLDKLVPVCADSPAASFRIWALEQLVQSEPFARRTGAVGERLVELVEAYRQEAEQGGTP